MDVKVNPRLKPKTCATCKTDFLGGATATYCPSCRAERIRERDRRRTVQQRAKSRKVGSLDICEICGDKYTINAGPQKYCEPCAVEQTKQRWQESFKRQYHGNPIRRQEILDRSQQWAKDHPDRVKRSSHMHYLNNIDAKTDRRRKMYGLKLRPLGRTETCPECGESFTVLERNQKYCDTCK